VNGPNNIIPTGLFWVIDNFIGMLYLTDIKPGLDAKVHYCFFDRRHIGREKLIREMLKFVFKEFQFERVTAEIPLYATRKTFMFAEQVGFKKEGRLRKAARYDGEVFDKNIYGITKGEVLNGAE
jgi:RimJ/RimL family protein N-acetyltransferase